MHEKLAYVIKHYALVQFLYRHIMSFIFRLWGLFTGFDENLVLFSSMSGDQYGGSPKVLFEKMKSDPRFESFHFVWAFSDLNAFDAEGADKVKIDSAAYFKNALRAKIWITDVNIERGLHFKKKNTVYLNTWHGTGPKKGGNAVAGRKDYDFSYVDIWCCDGEYTKNVFMKYWNAKEENMLMCGRPREDELFEFTPNDTYEIKKEIGIPQNKKVILYMPTWRDYGNRELTPELWRKAFDGEYVMLVRSHHFSKPLLSAEADSGFVYDVSSYQNVNKLYWIADILISDYSSAFFDYGLLGKPMYCYAYDYDKYKREYGLFIDLDKEFPNGVICSEEEVIDRIVNINYPAECKKSKDYCGRYVKHTVNAAECCLNEILKRI